MMPLRRSDISVRAGNPSTLAKHLRSLRAPRRLFRGPAPKRHQASRFLTPFTPNPSQKLAGSVKSLRRKNALVHLPS